MSGRPLVCSRPLLCFIDLPMASILESTEAPALTLTLDLVRTAAAQDSPAPAASYYSHKTACTMKQPQAASGPLGCSA